MRIAFFAPLKSPTHAVPSGDRRVGRLLVDALERAGHEVELVSALRTYEPDGDPDRQARLQKQGIDIVRDLVARWCPSDATGRPDLWFTYHVYYKAPDWLGPAVAQQLGIPYVIAEASYAPKRANGPWALGHAAAGEAIRAASLVLCPTKDDIACVESLVSSRDKVVWLPPFLDPAPYQAAARERIAHRMRLSAEHDLDPSVPWIVVAAMMRLGDKAASYRMLADALRRLTDIPWQVLVAGDGIARSAVEAAFEGAAPARARFLGECEAGALAAVFAASDLCMWPAVNEAYGMAMLEAQAAGLPVVSCSVRGVPDVVCHGTTGLLAPVGDELAFSALARELLVDTVRRLEMGCAAARFAGIERSVDAAAARLHHALHGLPKIGTRRSAVTQR